MTSAQDNESLLEIIQQLRLENSELEQARALNTLILNGLEAILNINEIDGLFAQFFKILQQAMRFDAALLTRYDLLTNQWYPLTSSKPVEKKDVYFLNSLHDDKSTIIQIGNLHLMADRPAENSSWSSMHSLLGTPVHTLDDRYKLWIFSTTIDAFNQQDSSLLQRFSSFAGTTISQFEQRHLRRKQKEMQVKQQQIERSLINSEKMASLGQMAAGVAHEINNPLSYVLSNFKNLHHNIDQFTAIIHDVLQQSDAKCQHYVRSHYSLDELQQDTMDILAEMNEGATRVKDIVQGLRQFSHPDQSQIDTVNLVDLIENTLRVAWSQIKYKATIEKHYGERPIAITARTSQLSQVVMNLLVNAAHALSDKQGVIRIVLCDDDTNAYMTVEDNGCGIAASQLSKVFDPFFTTKEVGEGTGLGLAISKAIVEQHQGTLQVKSTEHVGTCFQIMLPKAPQLVNEPIQLPLESQK